MNRSVPVGTPLGIPAWHMDAGRVPSDLPADDQGLDVVPAIEVRGVRDALLERPKELGDEAGGAILALAGEGAVQARPTPGEHAAHVLPCEDGGIVVPVGVVL